MSLNLTNYIQTMYITSRIFCFNTSQILNIPSFLFRYIAFCICIIYHCTHLRTILIIMLLAIIYTYCKFSVIL